ncbi:MAG TPA: alpha-L-fucosidase [Terriglobia bacterium]|nr:alpha-L-fucosidase [Terriglobia bacterium]
MKQFSRRDYFKLMGAGATALTIAGMESSCKSSEQPAPAATGQPAAQTAGFNTPPNRDQRMAWWREAKFGMFIHFGLYSVHGRHEWAMEEEGIPVLEYMKYAKRFDPKPGFARAWAKLAKQAGMKYMVMTSKHHEGFCNFSTDLTTYCAPKQGPGRDLVKEYIEAVRDEGLRVGLYYSLMDWHHPDGARCANDPAARQRFVAYTHGLIHNILSQYGKIDVLWYDVDWPLTPEGWESHKMNQMVFNLQPEIIVNNRNGLPGDFSTPEQHVGGPLKKGDTRGWETCMTMNDSWGFNKGDDDWKSPKTVLRDLITCARGGGNYLLNIGPEGDGSIPQPSVEILTAIGKWMEKHGPTIYGTDPCRVTQSTYAAFSRKGNTLYMHVDFWPGDWVAIGGLKTKVNSARMFATGQPVKVEQTEFQAKFTGLPEHGLDPLATVLEIQCDGEPIQDTLWERENKPRDGV